ncbi:MAG: response regulator [Chloroflexi bacterium]|nr:response regulator [Chloroflexota bacterium]
MAKILVIEDNATNLELMLYLLQAFGYQVASAPDGETGIELARRASPDLIICDIGLPGMDGFAVAARLKDHPALRTIPLVAVTALAMVGDRDRVLAAGFDGYIPKPIEPETFVRQVEKYLPHVRPAPQPTTPADTVELPPPARTGLRATILAVDNNAANLYLIQSILEPADYRVLTATTVQEALARAHKTPVDLIISDLHMPGQDGLALIRAVRADPRLKDIFILVHSASSPTDAERKRVLELGANCIGRTPLEPAAFLAQVEGCLAIRPSVS